MIAPAGCGKTHLIATSLKSSRAGQRTLVLTHTNAGVAALRQRFAREHIPNNRYWVHTIDGWAILITQGFPTRSQIDPTTFDIRTPGIDYPRIHEAAIHLLNSGHIKDAIVATYGHIIVDEYQDCSKRQHELITALAADIPTCVLGDPLQAIFGFGDDPLPDWHGEVQLEFPVIHEMSTPWRWKNADNEEFGDWLLGIRRDLADGTGIDLNDSPDSVQWTSIDRAESIADAESHGSLFVIGNSSDINSRNELAKRLRFAATVEPVDLKDLIAFAEVFHLDAPDPLSDLVEFAKLTMVNSSRGSVEKAGDSPESPSKQAARQFRKDPSFASASKFLAITKAQAGVRTYRPTLLDACIRALNKCAEDADQGLIESTIFVREQMRRYGRRLPAKAVGSTLLLKGLEAEATVIMDADCMNVRNLYVAMTRASHRLVICSRSPFLATSN